jgi:hypothetical protein
MPNCCREKLPGTLKITSPAEDSALGGEAIEVCVSEVGEVPVAIAGQATCRAEDQGLTLANSDCDCR